MGKNIATSACCIAVWGSDQFDQFFCPNSLHRQQKIQKQHTVFVFLSLISQ